MYYVTMRDKFMSGWGLANGKSNYLVFRCETEQEADIVADNAANRSDMHKIKIHDRYYKAMQVIPKRNLTQYYSFQDGQGYDSFYKKDYFKL
jgi:hypothetical protein